ncbi:hypothetical protein [Ramlibacter sp.]|uniref:hypothetical protein n=1 Tax=Ramlibacter sp. TaxID=1917967 RepID=UPI00262F23D4|nr:hypothetical protein [Ramlibacter sp.]MDB5958128.1 hypothetical protein [Ramlibacter sp.]
MQIRDHTHTAAAILLAGVVALFALCGDGPGRDLLSATSLPRLPPPGSNARVRFDACLQNVAVIHDLYWASACSVVAAEKRRRRAWDLQDEDDSPDCMLPEDRARRLNEGRAAAERECQDEAGASASDAAALPR